MKREYYGYDEPTCDCCGSEAVEHWPEEGDVCGDCASGWCQYTTDCRFFYGRGYQRPCRPAQRDLFDKEDDDVKF